MKRFLVCALALSAFGAAVRSGEGPAQPARIAFYNFATLIDKAERILLGEIGETRDGVTTVTVLESFKAPAPGGKKITADIVKRAEELLALEAQRAKSGSAANQPLDPPPPNVSPKPAPTAATAAQPDKVEVQTVPGILLPQKGVQVVFFLWEHAEKNAAKTNPDENNTIIAKPAASDDGIPRYVLAHPQAVYDPSVVTSVKAALFNPRSVNDGRFLRDWDRKAAEKMAQRKADEEIALLPAGESVRGLKLEARRFQLLSKGDNSFLFSTYLTNVFPKEQTVYDGPAPSYGFILRPKDGAGVKPLVLHINNFDSTDLATLNITNMTDFESIDHGKTFSHEQEISSAKFPILATLSGPYLLRAFYTNARDGQKDGVNIAWTGTVVSNEFEVEFKTTESVKR